MHSHAIIGSTAAPRSGPANLLVMARSPRDLDEDDVRVRPGRTKSRPRSKDRPAHLDAVMATVLTVDRGRFTCTVEAQADPAAPSTSDATVVMAVKARELGRKGVVVGDRVGLVGDVSGTTDALARIVRVGPRTSVLRRTSDDADPVERVLVANADQLAIVTSVASPEPRPRLIDRCLVAAFDAGLDPLLVLTKADLVAPEPLLATYEALGIPWVVTGMGVDHSLEVEPLRDRLRGRTTVFVGHSGVGKSTLVNALVPGTGRSTGAVNTVTGRGRHTSSSAVAIALPGGLGWVVDTPGVRSFGLAHVDAARVILAFPDLLPGTDGCPRGCSHDEPECALDAWAEETGVPHARLDSFRRLLRSRAAEDDSDG